MDKQEPHRPSALKQINKAHKTGRHRSKGSISLANKGKVSRVVVRRNRQELKKDQRRNQLMQIRKRKRDEVLAKKRALGSLNDAPFLVCVIPSNELISTESVLKLLTTCDNEAVVVKSRAGVTHILMPRFKQQFAFVLPAPDNYFALLDTLKVCDTVLLLVSANAGIEFGAELVDEFGEKVLASGLAQGLPSPVIAITDLEHLPPKKQNEQKHTIQKLMNKWFPDEKLMNLSSSADAINVLRRIGNQKRKQIVHKDRRPHLYAENVEFVDGEEGSKGTLNVTGYLRGTSLDVNGLIHVAGLGTFQMSRIVASDDPLASYKSTKKEKLDGVLATAVPAQQESLQSENEPNPMEGEQTWPTDEELKLAKEEANKRRKVKRIPKGWSEYQAAWIPDDDAEDDSEYEDCEDDSNEIEMISASEDESYEEIQSVVESEIAVIDDQYDKDLDAAEESADLLKIKAAKEETMFPDEIDTPQDVPAKVRFQKFRGLESFRTSPWDPKENLPTDYLRIFQFQNFDGTRRRITKEKPFASGVKPGCFITVEVADVPKVAWNAFEATGSAVCLVGLYLHENKMSLLNVALKRVGSYDVPIASKERLIFQCGYRRFITHPIFSQHTTGRKHKYERFFQPNAIAVASFYAPIQFPPAPVLCFKEVNSKLELIATGNLLSCNPDRIILKRIVLSGHPYKVYKRSAVIRFMFFNREDILYFKPCKLRTKYGRIGHIKEPLGTHGHMKCVFDGQLKSQDTVLLHLYKRVYPKWSFEECITCEYPEIMEM